jgi:hypothetical protein
VPLNLLLHLEPHQARWGDLKLVRSAGRDLIDAALKPLLLVLEASPGDPHHRFL